MNGYGWKFGFPAGTMFRKILFLMCFCLLGLAGSANADTIGPVCGSCFGSSYTVSYATTADPNVFDVTMTVDSTGFNRSNTDTLSAVGLKLVSNSSSISSVSLISAPSDFTSTAFTGLNANGCAGGSGGFFCSDANDAGLEVGHSGDIYSFTWAVTLNSAGDLLTGLDQASFKALYLDDTGKSNGVTSENISLTPSTSPVPEPSSFLLLGSGLIGAAGVLRRKVRA
jgi:hypothetical protein